MERCFMGSRGAECFCFMYGHRGALRGIPGSAFPQPGPNDPNATELPSCAPISARARAARSEGATRQLSGIWLGLWASTSGGAAQSAAKIINRTHTPHFLASSRRATRPTRARRRRRRWCRGEEGARRPGPEGQVLHHELWYVPRSALRRVLHVPVLHVGGGMRLLGVDSAAGR